jgi:hypothetical protein
MLDRTEVRTIFLREGTLLPGTLQLESEPYVPGWRLVKNLDVHRLDRGIQVTGWTFFCLAGEINAAAFGFDEPKVIRRAIVRILANPRAEKFNSMEITRVASAASKRFLGVIYVTVSARARHIQEPTVLSPADDRLEMGRAAAAAA